MFVFSLIVLVVTLAFLGLTLWNVASWPQVGSAESSPASTRLSILIPARDEETNIGECLESVLAQGEIFSEILIYDDHSRDDTLRVVSNYLERDARLKLVEPEPLPEGWCGKTFACAQLARQARGSWLLFLDADTRLQAKAVARMLAATEAHGVTLLSCWPQLEMHGFWERALMPLLNFVVFTLYPAPLALRRRLDPSLGLAHGSCLLAQRDAYEKVGGHTAVKDQLFEDVRLAQLWRQQGLYSLCLDGRAIVSVRMYCSLGGIWKGFQKNFFPAFRRERSFWSFLALHTVFFFLPFILAPLAFPITAGWILTAAAVGILSMRTALALRFNHPWWSVLLHPLGETMLIALGLTSWVKFRLGPGVEWKDRRYVQSSATGKGAADLQVSQAKLPDKRLVGNDR